jgi:hypothetical protein
MRYLLLLVVVAACGLTYVRIQRPEVWNNCLTALMAPGASPTLPVLPAASTPVVSSSGPVTTTPVPAPTVTSQATPVATSASAATNQVTSTAVPTPTATAPFSPAPVNEVEQPSSSSTAQAAQAPVTTQNPPSPKIPTSIPDTIKTLSGKTYTGCVLSQVTPDGISFMHSMGVAKVLFSDLDPAFAATFGYNPDAAEKYEQNQAAEASLSDAERAAQVARAQAAETNAAVTPDAPDQSATPKTLTQEQIDNIKTQIFNFATRCRLHATRGG